MLEEIKKFVNEFIGEPIDNIRLSSRVEQDFGLAGLDTILFYESFFEKFEIKNPEDFNLDEYCSPEGLEDLGLMIKAIFSKESRKKLKRYDVTIGHLIKVAETKVWVDFRS